MRFCATHLPSVDPEECKQQLIAQAATLQSLRDEAQHNLPGLSFDVQNAQGETIRFVHMEGHNPANEAAEFCSEHFGSVPLRDCVHHMLQNAQKAFEEASGGHR